ncbi:MAG: RNA 2',3'-cyclic phosphodiesterase [Candidatus Latescibacterota bacterium]|nr:MAG: RNA 2',3'-cyclic phosphodiesterase [Candidatus Latescibacterota bacterium]
MRLFVALLLDPAWIETLEQVLRQLRALDRDSSVRWVDARSIHLTLKFLGEVEEPRVDELIERLDAAVATRSAPRLALGGLGAFPTLKRPRVIWIGVEEDGRRLAPLQSRIEDAAAAMGWERERRAFQPHLTLGRARDPRRSRGGRTSAPVASHLAALPGIAVAAPAPSLQTRLALVRSHLGPGGARYESLHRWHLPET